MKELYIAPELEIMGFMAEEELAAEFTMEETLRKGGGVSADPDLDFDVEITY